MSATEDHTSGASGLREGYADIGDQRLHYVEAGDGPLIVLLHGFPEFWYGWRLQIQPLAAAGFRVVAPDMRGYNLSSKPDGVAAYDTGPLAADIRGLIHERGAESAMLVGHDWGGTAAWATAMNHPEVVDRLAILNAAHPRKLLQGLHHPGAGRGRLGPRPHRASVGGADEPARLHPLRRPGRRRGRPRHRRDQPPGHPATP